MANEENKKGTATLSAKEIKLQKRVNELEAKNAKLMEATEKEEIKVVPKTEEKVSDPLYAELKAQIKLLSDQVMVQQSLPGAGKPRYKPVPPDDFQEVGVTFSSRRIYFVIGSYLNSKGVEVMPPYKLIKFQYSASDRRREGREESIVNSCTFTTHLKAEIKFLKEHPFCGIEFFENLNETMSADSIYIEFRARAAAQVIAMTNEAVINAAHKSRVPNVTKLPIKELRRMLTVKLGDIYVRDAKELNDDIARRRLLAGATS